MTRNWNAAKNKVYREGECRICGSRFALDPAHVIPRSLGGTQSEDAIVPLCRTHHRAYDAHELDLLPALSYAEQAEAVRIVGVFRFLERAMPSEFGKVVPFPRDAA